jgi:outer membrane immunogenic protein
MRIALLATALAATTALATPAFAQDQDPSFTGPRAEAIAGWDRVADGQSGSHGQDGVVYGGAVGYDFKLGGSVVLGFEGEATGSTNKDTATSVIVTNDSLRLKAGRDLYAGGRIGFLAGPRARIYAKGGYTNAKLNTRYINGANTTNVSENADGWRLGAGAEFALSNHVYLKGEYRYSNYSQINGPNASTNIDLDRHQVVGGLGFRF